MRKSVISFLMLLFLVYAGHSNDKVVISQWMRTSPQLLEIPVFADKENIEGETFSAADLLEQTFISLEDHFPENGKTLMVRNGNNVTWREAFTDSNGYVTLEEITDTNKPQVSYLAIYIDADRWIKATLEIKTPHMLRAWLNGKVIGTKKTTEKEEKTVGKVTKELELKRGKHLLVMKTLKAPDATLEWKVMASLQIEDPYQVHDLGITPEPVHRKNIHHVLEGKKISSVDLSPNGTYYKVNYSETLPSTGKTERWSEIKRTEDKTVIHSFRHADVSRMTWTPESNKLSYTHSRNGKTTVFLHDIENGTVETLVEDMLNFSGYRWAPNEKYIIYSIQEKGKGADDDIRQVIGMADRQANFRNRTFLYKYELESNTHQRLTYGNLSSYLQDIHPQSDQILFSQSYPDYTEIPYSRQNMFVLNLTTMELDTLWADEWYAVSAKYSPEGDQLLCTGAPSAFNGAGVNVPDGTIPNNYDTQAYIYDLSTQNILPVTKNFAPSVSSATWNKSDNNIYLLVVEEDKRKLYRYDVRKEEMEILPLEGEFVASPDFAKGERLAVYRSNMVNAPNQYYLLNLKNLRSSILEDTESENYKHVELGEVHDWDFQTDDDLTIKGRVYYPPDFNPEDQYPVIVYYYGGTTPVGRGFGGRYPYNLWAGSGYLVYVLQPSGAIGFGQEFSAAHVNNWGITVADEIIEGTKKFLDAHSYADKTRIGCAGASYGGFMTMLLMTRTDLFTAAISHAGISALSSYWGEGYWGYSYSGVASAGSYPWNNKDLYINQSPLYSADKVNTPLLLLTGDSDTNVPPGESIQFYTALKILDKPVELVMVKDQDHHILNYNKRILWHNTIMAWWDKYLKDQPQWWENQYPEKNY